MENDGSRPDVVPYLREGQFIKDGRIVEFIWSDWCRTPPIPEDLTKIPGYGDPKSKFQRTPEPAFMKGVDPKAPTKSQADFIIQEDDRNYRDGYWFFIQGKYLTWITPWQYKILNYWRPKVQTKDGFPEYRNRDRLVMLYCWNCYKFWREYGVIYAKGRRLSATMFQHFLAYWFATLREEQNCGLSSTDEKLSRANFRKFLVIPIQKLPKWMRYTMEVTKDSISFTESHHIMRKGKESEALNSLIRLETSTEMGFDGDEMNMIGQDEIGKVIRFDITEWWSIQEKTMTNMGRKTGFAFLPSTSNKIEKGGKNYKKFFFDADLATTEEGKYLYTSNKLRNLFLPSYIGQPGFIGPYGEDIIDDPTDEQWEHMQANHRHLEDSEGIPLVRMGAKRKLELDAEQKKKQRESLWMEERRQNPFTIYDVFSSLNPFCPFDVNILSDLLSAVDVPEVQGRIKAGYFKALDKKNCRLPVWVDDPKGPVFRTWEPPAHTIGKFGAKNNVLIPLNHKLGILGLDPYAKTEVKQEGSKQGASGKLYFNEAYERANIRHIEETGMTLPDYLPTPCFFLEFVNRQNDPQNPNWDFEQMALIAQYYSMPISLENNRSAAFEKYMIEHGLIGFMLKKFEILGFENKKENQEIGIFTGSSEQTKNGSIGDACEYHNSFLRGDSVYLKEFSYNIVEQPIRYPFKQAIQDDMNFNLIDREKSDGAMSRLMLSTAEYNINDYGNAKWYVQQQQDGQVRSKNWSREGFFYRRIA
jgi:hypothetical protein